MSGETIRVEGLAQLRTKLKALDGGLDGLLKSVNLEAANLVKDAAKARAPKRTGRLAASIRASGTKTQAVVRVGGSQIPYAGPIHFGWAKHNIKPQPFLFDALDDRRPEVIARYELGIAKLEREVFP